MELWSVCIEETVYWTELANQTIYYIVSSIDLILMAHVTKCPFILRWANGLYIFWSTFTFFKLVCSDFHWLTRTLARHPIFTSLTHHLQK